jgi:hypothetical protein
MSDHVGQGRSDAVENASQVHIDHAVPSLDLAAFEQRVRHQAGIVDDHIDAPVRLNRAVNKMLYLFAVGDIGLDDGCGREANFLRQSLEPVEAACAEGEFCALGRKMTRGRFAETAVAPVMTTLPIC